MPEREYAFIVTSSERMTRRDHALRIAQARSVVTKRLHLAKVKVRDTSQGQGLLHPITAADKIDETAGTCLVIQGTSLPEDNQQTPTIDLVQPMSAALMLYRLSTPTPSLAFDPGVALNFVAHFTGKPVQVAMRPFGIVNSYDSWLRSQVVSNKANFHILLGSMKAYENALYDIEDCSPLQHRARAISELRNQLSAKGNIDINSIFFTMAILAVFDDTIGEDQAFEVHRKQLCNLIRGKGGCCKSLPTVNTAAVQHRFGTKYTQQRQPQICRPSLEWDSSPRGFQKLDLECPLSYNTRRIVTRVQQLKSTDQQLDDDEPVFANFQEACPALGIPDGPEGPHMERILCLALIRHCVNDHPDHRHLMINYHRVTMELIRALIAMTIPEDGVRRDFMLWTYMVAVDSWSPGHGRLAKEGFLLLRSVRQKFPEVRSWDATQWRLFAEEWSFWTQNLSLTLLGYWDVWLRTL